MQPDPLGLAAGKNPFNYVNQNPLNATDKDGLWSEQAHNYLIDLFVARYMPKAGRYETSLIKQGSSWTDRASEQLTKDTEPFHAMRAPGQSIDNAKEAACGYINPRLQYFKSSERSSPRKALINDIPGLGVDLAQNPYFQLGEAMHPIMDSTSPMHEGWQVWKSSALAYAFHWNSQAHSHGNNMHTEESLKHLLARPDLINLTLMRMEMEQALKTSNCSCLP